MCDKFHYRPSAYSMRQRAELIRRTRQYLQWVKFDCSPDWRWRRNRAGNYVSYNHATALRDGWARDIIEDFDLTLEEWHYFLRRCTQFPRP